GPLFARSDADTSPLSLHDALPISRIEAGAEQRHATRLLEALAIGPLPLVFELGNVARLVVRRVEVVDARFEAGIHQREVLVGQGDRKSTRLNSSHVKISYAVFCLK